jgi:hypothetical protein
VLGPVMRQPELLASEYVRMKNWSGRVRVGGFL